MAISILTQTRDFSIQQNLTYHKSINPSHGKRLLEITICGLSNVQ